MNRNNIPAIKTFEDKKIRWVDFREAVDLKNDEYHLFKVNVEEYAQQFSSMYKDVLTEPEFSQAKNFKCSHDTKRYLVTKFVLRNILSRFIPVPSREIQFYTTANKKPAVDGIEFNVTHSGNYILIAIGPSSVGVDMELVKQDFDFKLLMDHCFNKQEHHFIKEPEDFYRIWTRKEAVLKASGEGLTDHLDKINCLPDLVLRNQYYYLLQTFIIDHTYVASLATLNKEIQLFFWNYHII